MFDGAGLKNGCLFIYCRYVRLFFVSLLFIFTWAFHMSDEEIIAYIKTVPNFMDQLISQIGEIRRTFIDRENKHVFFFGSNKKTCVFQLGQILSAYEQEKNKPDLKKTVTFR